MNREIEFRGFDGTKWYYGDLKYNRKVDVAMIHVYEKDGWYYRQYNVAPDTVGQFTGLRDKNGVKIFEGDIVEVTSLRYREKDFMKKMLCEIVYDSDLCCFGFLVSDRDRCMCSTISDAEIEVIGNIYDNPELLDKKE